MKKTKKNSKMVVVITGVGGFIGSILAKEYKNLKYSVIGIDSASAEKKMSQLKKKKILDHYFVGDMASEDFIWEFEQTNLANMKVSILVNCVGSSMHATLGLGRFNDFRKLIENNLFTLWNSCSLFVPRMMDNGHGRIINFSSVFAKMPTAAVSYCTAKASILGFNRHLAAYCAPKNILVNTISPSHIKNSPRHSSYFDTKAGKEFINTKMPLKKLTDIDDIVDVILFLTSHKNKSITGQNIIVDGGLGLRPLTSL